MGNKETGQAKIENPFEGKRILLVEDDPMTATVEGIMLENYGFRVTKVKTGEDAIKLFNQGTQIDLVLMDIDLGGGIEGTDAAQEILAHNDVPLIFLSSHTEREIVNKTEGITSYGYCVKNSGEMVLIASIKMAFRLFYAKKREIENEKALIRNQYLLSEAIRLSALGTWELHLPEHDCFLSNRFIQIHGIKENIVSLDDFFKLFHPEDRERVSDIVKNAMEDVSDFEFESRIIRQEDGKIRWVHGTGTVTTDENGGLSRIYGAARDITYRKVFEEELRDERDELSAIYQNTPVLMLLLDMDARIKKANSFASEYTGIPREQLIGRRGGDALSCIQHINHPDGCGSGPNCINCKLRSAVTDTIKNGTSYSNAEIIIISKTGNKSRDITLQVSTTILRHRGEDLCLVAIDDITKRKEMEKALDTSEEKNRSFYHAIPVISHYLDEEGKIIDVTDSWLKELGYEREDVIGKRSVDFLTEESRKYVVEKAYPEFLKRGSIDYLPVQFLKMNGQIMNTLLSARVEYDNEGKFLHSIAILVNITEVDRHIKLVS